MVEPKAAGVAVAPLATLDAVASGVLVLAAVAFGRAPAVGAEVDAGSDVRVGAAVAGGCSVGVSGAQPATASAKSMNSKYFIFSLPARDWADGSVIYIDGAGEEEVPGKKPGKRGTRGHRGGNLG